MVVDALAWEGATLDDLAPLFERAAFGQLLLRALRFRIVVADLLEPDGAVDPEARFASGVALARTLAG